jgi:hypothetical protein
MHTPAFVVFRHVGQKVRRLDLEYAKNIHGAIVRSTG